MKWSHLCAYFHYLLPPGDYLLVILDEYSRFPEVEIIESLSAQTVIPVFDKIFSYLCTPDKLKFRFQMLCERSWFSPPAYHAVLARSERCRRQVYENHWESVQAAHVDGESWKQQVNRFLINYRATPLT